MAKKSSKLSRNSYHTLGNTNAYRKLTQKVQEKVDEAQKEIENALTDIGEQTVKKIKEYVKLYYYNAYPEGDNYNRLEEKGGFLHTISYEVNVSNFSIKIYCDWSLLAVSDKPDPKFPHHWENGQAFTYGLYDYMMYGSWPFSRSNRVIQAGFRGIDEDMTKEIKDFLDWYVSDLVSARLEKLGFNVSGLKHGASVLRSD